MPKIRRENKKETTYPSVVCTCTKNKNFPLPNPYTPQGGGGPVVAKKTPPEGGFFDDAELSQSRAAGPTRLGTLKSGDFSLYWLQGLFGDSACGVVKYMGVNLSDNMSRGGGSGGIEIFVADDLSVEAGFD